MKRFLAGLALGVVLGVLLCLGPGPVVDSPWPEPTPILAVVDVAGLAQAQCQAAAVKAKLEGWAAQRSTPCECGR